MKRRNHRSVCVIQHAAAEPPGLVGDILRREGWEVRLIRTYRRESVPERLREERGLVVLGGPMSVYDKTRFPTLAAERQLIGDALARHCPVLGLGLGSQLLAATLGATVVPAVHKELGWHPVHFTRSASKDPLWRGLTEDLTAFHWHGDRFDCPRGAVSLARSELTECQAFRWEQSAYGILFHLEADQRAVIRITRAFQAETIETGQRPEDIVEGVSVHLPTLARVGTEVFHRWVRLLAIA